MTISNLTDYICISDSEKPDGEKLFKAHTMLQEALWLLFADDTELVVEQVRLQEAISSQDEFLKKGNGTLFDNNAVRTWRSENNHKLERISFFMDQKQALGRQTMLKIMTQFGVYKNLH